jgi:RHS repeat-associated protein
VTKYAIDGSGAATRVEEPLGRVTRVWRNKKRQDTLTISPRGDSVRMVWTGPNLTQIVRRPLARIINIEYETAHNEVKHVYGDADSLWNYWSFGRLDSTRVGSRADTVTKFQYDSRGRDTLVIDPKDHRTRRYFASTGWQNTDSVKNETRRTAFAYDSFGRDTLRKDPQNNIWKTNYDVINRVIRRIGAAPIYDTTTFVYDSLYLSAVIDAKAQRSAFAVNALGWVVSDTNPLGVAKTFAFDSNGNITSTTNRRGQTITFTYDSLENLRARVTPDAGTTMFISDPLERFVAVSNGESVDTLKFDISGRPTNEIAVHAGTRYELASTLDIRDRRTRLHITAPGWSDSIRYSYNARSALDSLIDVSGRRTKFVYNSDGALTEIQLPNGVNVTHGFPSTHTPARIQYSVSAINDTLGRNYGYDSLARVSERLNTAASAGREFSYDEIGRLKEYRDFHMDGAGCSPVYEYDDPPPGAEPIGWSCSGGSRVVDQTVTYSYDKVGNRLDLGAIVTAGNRLAKFDGDSLIYDADGNLVRRTVNGNDLQRLYWNSLGELIAVWTVATDSVNYAYDGSGRRVRRWIGATTRRYLHDDDDLFAEIDGASTVFGLYSYYPGIDWPHSVRRVGAMYYYALDLPGNVSGMLDSAGALINRFTYAPHGGLQDSDVGMPSEPLRFSAREFEGETGLYFMRARYYDPAAGRFISEDPIGLDGGINPYVFAGNDPVNARDPLGLAPGCEMDERPAQYFTDESGNKHKVLDMVVTCGSSGGGFSIGRFWHSIWSAGIPWGSTHLVSSGGTGGWHSGGRGTGATSIGGAGEAEPAVEVAGRKNVSCGLQNISFQDRDRYGRQGTWIVTQVTRVNRTVKIPRVPFLPAVRIDVAIYGGTYSSPSYTVPLLASGQVFCAARYGIFEAFGLQP